MTLINRQRYMAELSKLLTFMFKEDRDEILQHYNELLDNAEDEGALLESFGSPTKLAVTISRTYSREDRKLEVHADSRDNSQSSAPLFKPSAEELKSASEETAKLQKSRAELGSYADIIEEIRKEVAEEQGLEYKPIFGNDSEESEAPDEVDLPAPETADVQEDAPVEEETDVEEEITPEEEAAVIEKTADLKAEDDDEAVFIEENLAQLFDSFDSPKNEVLIKTNVPALVFYTIGAVIVGIAALAVLIPVGIAVLCIGLIACFAGLELINFAFSGIQLLADILLVLGTTIVLLAISLLLIWLALWMLISGIRGLIRGLKSLGRKLCTKEVTING